MLKEGPALPLLEMAWSPSQMQQFLNQRVLPLVWPSQAVTAVAIEDMTFRADHQCEILYALQLGDLTGGYCQRVVVTLAKAHRLEEIYRRHYGGEGGASNQPTPSPVVFLPESECLVEFFPVDWQLPALAWALEPGAIASFLSPEGPQAEPTRGLPQVEVLRYRLRSRRCVLRYKVEAPDGRGSQEVIGKVYPCGAQALQVAQVLTRLHPQAAACGLILPQPLQVVPERSLLLMERLPGTVLKLVLKRAKAPPQFQALIRLAAATLVRLHRLQCESQDVQSVQTQVEKLRPQVASLHVLAPRLAPQVEALLQQIEQAGARCPAVAPCFVHGDFSPGQLLLMETGQMGVIDFDLASLGDPALDVGNFMARLHHKAVSKASNAFRQVAAYFLSEYQACLPEPRVAERVHLFLSISLVRRALREFEIRPYDYCGRADPDSPVSRLLQEAAAYLAER